MNQYFYDEIKCIYGEISKMKMSPTCYESHEINIVGDEHTLAAYLAAYYSSVSKKENGGAVNVISNGKWRNKEIYDDICDEYSCQTDISLFSSFDDYIKSANFNKNKLIFYILNFQLDEYSEELYVKDKKENIAKWIDYSKENNCCFIFIPIFNFKEPFPHGIAACSEREVEAISLYTDDFYQGNLVMEFEEICRKHFLEKEMMLKVVRFDNIFGPLIKNTSKIDFDGIINKLLNENVIKFDRKDVYTFYTATYIRQAISAIHCISIKGLTGNIYNAANYRFTLHDLKNNLYKSFSYRKPEVSFDDTHENFSCETGYECLSNLKIKNLGWKIVTPLQEALYRTALAKTNDDYIANFYVNIYQGKLDRIKNLEMDIIREIDRICKANNIKYFLVGGSLLGAVRHQGFIPWDDDIDIGMLREDYNKFRKVCPEKLSDKMRYQSYKQEKDSHYIFEKIRLKETYFSTKFSNRFNNIENGIFVDVLVYDKTSDIKVFQKLHIKLIKAMNRIINVRWVNVPRKGLHYKATKIFLPIMRLIPFKVYHWCFEAVLRMFNWKKNGKYLIDGVGQNIGKGAFPASWFDEMIQVPYEDMVFDAPAKYDEYLRHWYGEHYMELLPISSRKSGHKLMRMDLGKYLFNETENQQAHVKNFKGELYEEPLK